MEIKFDGHLHTIFSDGLSSPEEVVDSLVKKGFQLVGLTDHGTLSGVDRFLGRVEHWKALGYEIFGVPGVEAMTEEGFELATFFPIESEWKKFAAEFGERPVIRASETIKRAVRYSGFAVIVHPGMGYPVPAIKFTQLRQLVESLTESEKKYLGIEIHNGTGWMMSGNKQREASIAELNKFIGLAEFGFSDSHHASLVGSCFTDLRMKELTAGELLRAIEGRKTKAKCRKRSVIEKIKEALVIASAVFNDRAGVETRPAVKKLVDWLP